MFLLGIWFFCKLVTMISILCTKGREEVFEFDPLVTEVSKNLFTDSGKVGIGTSVCIHTMQGQLGYTQYSSS